MLFIINIFSYYYYESITIIVLYALLLCNVQFLVVVGLGPVALELVRTTSILNFKYAAFVPSLLRRSLILLEAHSIPDWWRCDWR